MLLLLRISILDIRRILSLRIHERGSTKAVEGIRLARLLYTPHPLHCRTAHACADPGTHG
jgi:hypothetical protein